VSLIAALQQRNWIKSACQLLLTAVLCSLLAACASSGNKAKVVDRNDSSAEHSPAVTSGQYVVHRGDTLYSIAFRYGWDWKALAAHNNIPAPYTIRPGQAILWRQRIVEPSVVTKSAACRTCGGQQSQYHLADARQGGSGSRCEHPASPRQRCAFPVLGTGCRRLDVADQGTLIGRFASNGSLNKGIDIAGQLGQPVLAASDGTVVYAGSGLRGYGELVIIKHSDTYVSAYGHNRRLLVREGQQVKSGRILPKWGLQAQTG
jgi:lipoprotein NlpD